MYGVASDFAVLWLPWFLFTICLLPLGVWNQLVVSVLALAYALTLSCILAVLSWSRSTAWLSFSMFCGVAAVAGFCMGLYSSGLYILVCLATLLVLAGAASLGCLLPRLGCGIIGSSASVAELQGWGWEPKAVVNMGLGLGWDGWDLERLTQQPQEYPERVRHDLLKHRAYWSGEPALDYAHFLSQEHMFVSCFLAHPAAPISRFERVLVCCIVSCLIVFPVAWMGVTLHEQPLLRLCATAVLVTVPRNALKFLVLRAAATPEALRDDERARWGPKLRRLVMKHFTRRGRASVRVHSKLAEFKSLQSESQEVRLFMMVSVFTACVCYACAVGISAVANLQEELSRGFVGVLYCFVLELIFQLLIRARPDNGPKRAALFVGFFDQWWRERTEYGSLKPSGTVFPMEPTGWEFLRATIRATLIGA